MAQSPNIPTLLLCSILLFSCMKEEEITRIEEGLPTEILLTLSTSAKPVTRADANALEGETKFFDADVFIFDAATGLQINHHRLPASAFSSAPSGPGYDAFTYTSTTKISATTGERKIIVGVNLSDALSEKLDGEPISTFTTVPYTLDLSDGLGIIELTGKAEFNRNSDIPALYDPRFVMFSTTPITLTLRKDPDFEAQENSPVVQVQRMVAKVSVETAEHIEIISDCLITNLSWRLKQVNTKTFWVQPADKKDPNWANTPTGDLAIFANSNRIRNMAEHDTPFSQRGFSYVPENTTKDYLRGQLTYVCVSADVQPYTVKVYVNGINGNDGYRDKEYSNSVDEWGGGDTFFWMVTYNQGTNRAYFLEEKIANDFAAEHEGASKVTYNGRCEWVFFLNPNNNYNVLRNDYYRCRITKIVGIGRPYSTVPQELPDPHLPPVASTDIMVDVKVVAWDTLLFNTILE